MGIDLNTVLLMHMDGADEGAVFTDDAQGGNAPHSISRFGDTVTKTDIKKFGTASVLFDGDGDYLQASADTDFDFSGDFTIECWIYPNNVAYGADIIGNGWNAGWNISRAGDSLTFWVNGVRILNASVSLVAQVWQHIAVVRLGTTITVYVEGEAKDSATFTDAISSTSNLTIGRDSRQEAYYTGYMDEVRISTKARYSSDFDPPDQPFSESSSSSSSCSSSSCSCSSSCSSWVSTSSSCSSCSCCCSSTSQSSCSCSSSCSSHLPYDQYTVLLLHMDGSEGGVVFIDDARAGEAPHTINVAGDAHTTTLIKKIGTASLEIDGLGDWLVTNDSPDWDLSADFTIEFWFRPSDLAYGADIIGTGYNEGWNFLRVADTIQIWFADTRVIATGAELSVNTWHHVALVRYGSTITLYIDGDGKSDITYTDTIASNNMLYIGRDAAQDAALYGHLDELRISNGKARYRNNFPPPVNPFDPYSSSSCSCSSSSCSSSSCSSSKSSSSSSCSSCSSCSTSSSCSSWLSSSCSSCSCSSCSSSTSQSSCSCSSSCSSHFPFDLYTVLLLHMDGSEGGTSFPDDARAGEAPHAMSVHGDAHTTTAYKYFGTASLELDGDEDAISAINSPDWDFDADLTIEFWMRPTILSSGSDIIGTGWNTGWSVSRAADSISFWANGERILISGTDLVADEWQHIAVVRYGSALTLYIDGNAKATTTYTEIIATSNTLYVGRDFDEDTPFIGQLDEVRISKGKARYRHNFDPPENPFTPLSSSSCSCSSSSCSSSSCSCSSSSCSSSSCSSSSCSCSSSSCSCSSCSSSSCSCSSSSSSCSCSCSSSSCSCSSCSCSSSSSGYLITVGSGDTTDIGIPDAVEITYTGGDGTTATIIVNSISFIVKNDTGQFVWDFGGGGEYTFSAIGETINRNAGGQFFNITWNGFGSLVFTIDDFSSSSSCSSSSCSCSSCSSSYSNSNSCSCCSSSCSSSSSNSNSCSSSSCSCSSCSCSSSSCSCSSSSSSLAPINGYLVENIPGSPNIEGQYCEGDLAYYNGFGERFEGGSRHEYTKSGFPENRLAWQFGEPFETGWVISVHNGEFWEGLYSFVTSEDLTPPTSGWSNDVSVTYSPCTSSSSSSSSSSSGGTPGYSVSGLTGEDSIYNGQYCQGDLAYYDLEGNRITGGSRYEYTHEDSPERILIWNDGWEPFMKLWVIGVYDVFSWADTADYIVSADLTPPTSGWPKATVTQN